MKKEAIKGRDTHSAIEGCGGQEKSPVVFQLPVPDSVLRAAGDVIRRKVLENPGRFPEWFALLRTREAESQARAEVGLLSRQSELA